MEYIVSPLEWIEFYYQALNDISRSGQLALYKIGDVYYSGAEVGSAKMWWLKLFPDGVLLPGHIRQAIYNIYLLTRESQLNKTYPLFVNVDKYGIRIFDGTKWSGYIPVITSDSKMVLRLCRLIYKNINEIWEAQLKRKT